VQHLSEAADLRVGGLAFYGSRPGHKDVDSARSRFDRPFRLLFISGRPVGHRHAVLGVARRLVRQGHSVVFATSGPTEAYCDAGFRAEQQAWLSGGAHDLDRRESRRSRVTRIREAVAAADNGARTLVECHRPDLVLYQPFMLEFHPLLHRHGAKNAVTFSTKPLLAPDPLVPPYTSRFIPGRGAGARAAVALAWTGAWCRYARFRSSCAWRRLTTGGSRRSFLTEIARKVQYPLAQLAKTRPLDIDLRLADVAELVLHAKEFEFDRAWPLPPDTHYIGPCIDDARLSTSGRSPTDGTPLVYCHLGTEALQHDELKASLYFRLLRAAESSSSFRWLFSVGSAELQARLGAARSTPNDPRIRIETWVPQLPALQEACAAILHGGANSVKEAIYCRCPILVLPQYADQPGVAARVSYHNLGRVASARNVRPDEILAALTTLMSDQTIQNSLERMRENFLRYDRDRVAERTIEHIASRTPYCEGERMGGR